MIENDNFEEAVANGNIVLLGIKQICIRHKLLLRKLGQINKKI